MVSSTRKNVDVSRERWDSLVRLVQKTGLESPGNAQVLDVLEKLARKGLKAVDGVAVEIPSVKRDDETPAPQLTEISDSPLSPSKGRTVEPVESPELVTAQGASSSGPSSLSTGQVRLTTFPAVNWLQDYQERKLEYLHKQLQLEERKQDFREKSFDERLDFLKDALRFQRERHKVLPIIDTRGTTNWRDDDQIRAYRERDGWKNVE